jgi:hypothetical protein
VLESRTTSEGTGRYTLPINGGWLAATNAVTLDNVATKFLARSGKGRFPYYHQETSTVPHKRLPLVRFVADPSVVSHRDPAFGADTFEPLFVGPVRRKEIGVPDDRKAGVAQDVGELLAEISVGEKRQTHAARS